MFIPVGTDYRRKRRPTVNHFLVAVNVLVYFAGFNYTTEENASRIIDYMLHPHAMKWYQFFTSMFLHADIEHLLFNMLFLWIFGNNINDRLRNPGYFVFYIAAGVASAAGYLLLGQGLPVLGASGAIAAVTGAYLVLLPGVRITLWVFFFIITRVQVSSLLFLGLKLLHEIYMTASGGGTGVAYEAHIAGYVFGILTASSLLLLRIIPRDQFDLLYLIRHRYRREKFRRLASAGHDPFLARWGGNMLKAEKKEPPRTVSKEETESRNRIREHLKVHDTAAASKEYLKLREMVDRPRLPEQSMLDIANQLTADKQYQPAVDLYEQLAELYTEHARIGEISLMLGLIYGRYLNKDQAAEVNLKRAIELLIDPSRRKMAEADLRIIQDRLNKDMD